ncbi:MAG: UbiD family decarboxylase [Pseudomonadales bacterium]|nr:UbiD family decarboxylase [Pseudomonadales bacterium]
MRDLRSFLDAHRSQIWQLPAGLAARYELTALQHELDVRQQFPILFARRLAGIDDGATRMPLVTNLTASRALTAAALGIDDHRRTAQWFAARTAAGIAPQVIAQKDAPVQEIVLQGDGANLLDLPLTVQHELEPGPYLTAAHATTYDPDTGIDNTAIQRCWVKAPRRMTYFPYPTTHNARNVRKFWVKGEAAPVAFWIGHHPAVLLGTQAKLRYPESHWVAAGGVLGEPLRVVPTITHGEKIMVPADAEIVIEGFVPPGQMSADGPFGEYTGYLGAQVQAPLCEITCISRRRDAIYHDYGSGLTDMLVPDNMAMEGKVYSIVKAVAPSLLNVYVPASGRRFHAWLQFENPARGEVRDALAAALAYRRLKTIVAVDEDIDIFDTEAVMWALATRVQWARDAIVLDGLSGSNLDPSMQAGAQTVSKIGIDATLPPRSRAGAPRAVAPVATVPLAARQRARELLAEVAPADWPQY